MGSVGDAYDNAMAESFFASLECELIDRRSWKNKTEARLAIFTWIESLLHKYWNRSIQIRRFLAQMNRSAIWNFFLFIKTCDFEQT